MNTESYFDPTRMTSSSNISIATAASYIVRDPEWRLTGRIVNPTPSGKEA